MGEWSCALISGLDPDLQLHDGRRFASCRLTDLHRLGAGGDFALLLDSDCHYFFDNITFTLTTSSPVPEPGSILLLVTVLAGVGIGLRKKKAATVA